MAAIDELIKEIADPLLREKFEKEIEKSKLKELEAQISKKFSANIKLEPVIANYNGVKIDVEDLGFEISFSIDRLKNKMSEYILKPI